MVFDYTEYLQRRGINPNRIVRQELNPYRLGDNFRMVGEGPITTPYRPNFTMQGNQGLRYTGNNVPVRNQVVVPNGNVPARIKVADTVKNPNAKIIDELYRNPRNIANEVGNIGKNAIKTGKINPVAEYIPYVGDIWDIGRGGYQALHGHPFIGAGQALIGAGGLAANVFLPGGGTIAKSAAKAGIKAGIRNVEKYIAKKGGKKAIAQGQKIAKSLHGWKAQVGVPVGSEILYGISDATKKPVQASNNKPKEIAKANSKTAEDRLPNLPELVASDYMSEAPQSTYSPLPIEPIYDEQGNITGYQPSVNQLDSLKMMNDFVRDYTDSLDEANAQSVANEIARQKLGLAWANMPVDYSKGYNPSDAQYMQELQNLQGKLSDVKYQSWMDDPLARMYVARAAYSTPDEIWKTSETPIGQMAQQKALVDARYKAQQTAETRAQRLHDIYAMANMYNNYIPLSFFENEKTASDAMKMYSPSVNEYINQRVANNKAKADVLGSYLSALGSANTTNLAKQYDLARTQMVQDYNLENKNMDRKLKADIANVMAAAKIKGIDPIDEKMLAVVSNLQDENLIREVLQYASNKYQLGLNFGNSGLQADDAALKEVFSNLQ